MWYIYIVRCSDNTLYTGITTDISRRMREHNSSTGAKYTRSKRPVTLVYQKSVQTRSRALKHEAAIKSLSKQQKEALISAFSPQLDSL